MSFNVMAGRIEMPLSQYEQMLKDTKELNDSLYNLRKERDEYAAKLNMANMAIEELYNSSLYERTIGWLELKSKVNNILTPKDGNIETN